MYFVHTNVVETIEGIDVMSPPGSIDQTRVGGNETVIWQLATHTRDKFSIDLY